METVFRVLVLSVLGAWMLLSTLTVARCRWLAGRRRWDRFELLSGWRLFVSADGAHPAAYALLYRDRLRDGSLGPLRTTVSGTVVWSVPGLFWDARWGVEVMIRRLIKGLYRDLRRQRGDREAAVSSRAYRHLRHIVSRCPRSDGAEARQFTIIATYGELSGRPPARIFQSAFHDL